MSKIYAEDLVKLGFKEVITEWCDYDKTHHLIFYTLDLPNNLTLYSEYHAWAKEGYWIRCYEREEIQIDTLFILKHYIKEAQTRRIYANHR